MIRVFAFLLLCLPGLASAQPYPALHDVSGVAADDVLNIRTDPEADAPILGTLAPGAAGIEVVRRSDDGRWGLVNQGDSAGWVSLRYMARHPGQDWGVLPAAFYCGGTEPFWSFEVGGDGAARFTSPEGNHGFRVTARLEGAGYPGDFAVRAEGPAGRAAAMVFHQSCNDGMSNREFGMTLGLLLETADPEVFHVGCCSLQR